MEERTVPLPRASVATGVCACGGPVSVVKKKCYMSGQEYGAERGWDYWAECSRCVKGFFGYTPEKAIERLQQEKPRG